MGGMILKGVHLTWEADYSSFWAAYMSHTSIMKSTCKYKALIVKTQEWEDKAF